MTIFMQSDEFSSRNRDNIGKISKAKPAFVWNLKRADRGKGEKVWKVKEITPEFAEICIWLDAKEPEALRKWQPRGRG